ncbi:MAG: leucine--tRNA ligase [Candidatus Saccharibacteria bacterium]|nr:leucine--tRNA ligase [Candidatus Saccharibacteria bacterium]
MNHYKPLEVEPKWQKIWQDQKIYEIDLKTAVSKKRPKFYGFGMFNYPSGEGIHVGHVKNFTIPDVLLRFYRQKGWAVYSPVGFDSFGLPAENYALKTGIAPRITTDKAIANFSQQYQALGFSFDWSKVIDTSQADYYRWTQWCFLQLYEAGLAYQKESSQWWCDQCKTVLADEQVIGGRCWRHDNPSDPLISRKSLKQWFLKITNYASEILKATDGLNWTDWVKLAQKNYIGRSEGFEIDFQIINDKQKEKLTVFTTALETIHGATFMVLAPEHPLIETLIKTATNKIQIKRYIKLAQTKTEVDRQKALEKTGIAIKGWQAINPVTQTQIPIWIADYVLGSYGTGSIMAVPGADERDLEFAQIHKLPVIYVTQSQEFIAYKDMSANLDQHKLVSQDDFNGLTMAQARQDLFKWLKKRKVITEKVNFKLRDWLISRQRYWGAPIPIVFCQDCGAVPVPEADLPVVLPEIDDYTPSGDGRSPLTKATDWLQTTCPKCHQIAQRETDTMDGYVCSSWYQFRYLSPHDDNQAWDVDLAKTWLPVDFYNGADHATAHLIYARFFTRFFYDQGLVATPEPFQRMYLHGKILASDGQNFSKSKGNGIDPLEVINQGYGADALRLYLCLAAPPDLETIWQDSGVAGAYKFLNRVWVLVSDYLKHKYVQLDPQLNLEIMRATHQVLDKVTKDIQALKYNTAVASLMTLVNHLYKFSQEDKFQNQAWQLSLEALTMMLAPFTPHFASELWQKLGHSDQVHLNHWPSLDEQYLKVQTIKIPIQINGKLRGQLDINPQASEAEVLSQAQQVNNLAKYLYQGQIIKAIYIPQKIINFVVDYD